MTAERISTPVLLIGTAPYLLSTAKAKPFNTLADVIEAARKNPGSVSYGSVESAAAASAIWRYALWGQRLPASSWCMRLLSRRTAATTDALGGHVDILVGSTALSMPQVNTGNLRAIAQTGKTRNQFLADVPTLAESGYPGFEAYAWWGIFAPAGTPKPIIEERFGTEMTACLRDER